MHALRAASFVFTRERTSLRLLAGAGVDGPQGASADDPATAVNEAINRAPFSQFGLDLSGVNADFVPDTTFAFSARDDAKALAFMRAKGLESGKFACFVPRLRWTPNGGKTRQGDSRDDHNTLYLKADHDKLKTAIVDCVRSTGHKVALVPESVYVVGLLAALLKDGLPEDVAAKVLVRDNYWLPDEAASLFARAQVVVSIENHSPILAAAAGTPFLMVHQPEDSFKADMFRDIGLGDWSIPDINQASGADVSAALLRARRTAGYRPAAHSPRVFAGMTARSTGY